MQAHFSDHRPGFWAILSAVFAASWLGGAAAAMLWGLICCFAVVDVLRRLAAAESPRRLTRARPRHDQL